MTRGYAAGMAKVADILGMSPETFGHVAELTGLGALAAYPAYHLYKALQEDEPVGEHAMELGGLGILAAPAAIHLLRKGG